MFQIHDLLFVVELGVGDGSEVNVAGLAVGFAQVLQTLGDFFAAENVAVLHGEKAAQGGDVRDGFVVLEGDRAEAVALAFLDGHGDIDGFPQPCLEQRNVEACVSGVVNLGLGIVDQHLEVAAVLELGADAFGIFFELGGVVGLGEEVFKEDGVRDADGLEVLHGRAQTCGH